jgi:hypothetical protein
MEEPERSCLQRHRFRRQLPFPQQVELILTYLLRALVEAQDEPPGLVVARTKGSESDRVRKPSRIG